MIIPPLPSTCTCNWKIHFWPEMWKFGLGSFFSGGFPSTWFCMDETHFMSHCYLLQANGLREKSHFTVGYLIFFCGNYTLFICVNSIFLLNIEFFFFFGGVIEIKAENLPWTCTEYANFWYSHTKRNKNESKTHTHIAQNWNILYVKSICLSRVPMYLSHFNKFNESAPSTMFRNSTDCVIKKR